MGSKRICVSQARTEFHNLLSLLKFGCYLAVSATVVKLKRTWLCHAERRLLVLTRGDELNFSIFSGDLLGTISGTHWHGSAWRCMSGRLRD